MLSWEIIIDKMILETDIASLKEFKQMNDVYNFLITEIKTIRNFEKWADYTTHLINSISSKIPSTENVEGLIKELVKLKK